MTCTIVVIWNKEDIYTEFLDSLKKQKDVDFKIIGIKNDNHQYVGARQAYNDHLRAIEGSYVIFMHPDIRFLDEYALYDLLENVKKTGDFGVVGVAGTPEGKNWQIYSDIIHGMSKENAGKSVKGQKEVQTVDECLFVMNASDIKNKKFSLLEGWHLYAVEQCVEYLLCGKKNYVIPARLWHMSAGGSLDPSYMITLNILIRKYKNELKYLNTTVKQWKTNGMPAAIYRIYYYYKQKLKRWLQCRKK